MDLTGPALRRQVVELTREGRVFLEVRFRQFDRNEDGMLSSSEQEEAFSTAPFRHAAHAILTPVNFVPCSLAPRCDLLRFV